MVYGEQWIKVMKDGVNVLFFCFFKQKTAYELAQCLVGSEMCIRDRTTRVSEARARAIATRCCCHP